VKTLPVELLVENRHAVVIGGDDECLAKVERLLDAGADVHVIADQDPHPEIEQYARRGALQLSRRAPTEEDANAAFILFVGPDHRELGASLFAQAVSAGRLICCLDFPQASTFVNPSVTQVSGLRVTLSSAGNSPGLLKRLREDLVAVLSDPRMARFVEKLGELRRSLPAGQRKAPLQKAVAGFKLSAELTFPDWFERDASPPGGSRAPHE